MKTEIKLQIDSNDVNIELEILEDETNELLLINGYAREFSDDVAFSIRINMGGKVEVQFGSVLIAETSEEERAEILEMLTRMIEPIITQLKKEALAQENKSQIDLFENENRLIEEGELDDEDIKYPFDPKLIKIIVEPKTIGQLVERLKHEEIDLNTEFQRKGNLWTSDQQSRLIESIMLRFPLPAFYFDAENEDKWLVVDGLQRLWTIKRFIVDENLKLSGLELLREYSGGKIGFTDLNRNMQRRILETPITTYIIQPGTPKHVKYNVFRRINTGGLGLNAMEIRHALNIGAPSKFLQEISESLNFKSKVRVRDKRMEDRELILRSIAFMLEDYRNYAKPLATFLDRSMEKLGQLDSQALNNIKIKFYRSLDINYSLFGENAFSRSINNKNQYRLNNALFETWVSSISVLDELQCNKLDSNKEALVSEYLTLLENENFTDSVTSSTSNKSSIMIRFGAVTSLIKKYSE